MQNIRIDATSSVIYFLCSTGEVFQFYFRNHYFIFCYVHINFYLASVIHSIQIAVQKRVSLFYLRLCCGDVVDISIYQIVNQNNYLNHGNKKESC